MRLHILTILFVMTLIFALSFSSCVKSEDGGEEGIPVTISLDAATRVNTASDYVPGDGDRQDGRDADRAINSLRVLVYETRTGQLQWNYPIFIHGGQPVKPDPMPDFHEINIRTGIFNFVFVANEHSDVNLNLDESNNAAFNTWEKLCKLTFDDSAFGEGTTTAPKNIPMVTTYTGVTVQGDYHLEYDNPFDDSNSLTTVDGTDGSLDAGVWKVPMERVSIRLSMTITLTTDQYNDYAASSKSIYIGRWAQKAYVLSGIANDASQVAADIWKPYVFYEQEDLDGLSNAVVIPPDTPGGEYTINFERIILPELLFADKDNADKAMVLAVKEVDKETRIGKICPPPSYGFGYTLPRNIWLHLDVRIIDRTFEMHTSVLDWTLYKTEDGKEIVLN